MSRADLIDASWLSLRSLFPTRLDPEAEAIASAVVGKCNPPIRAVIESTWALKAGGLVHCAVCLNVRGVRVETPRERRGLCEGHADWKIFYRHHSWSEFEQYEEALKQLNRWLREAE